MEIIEDKSIAKWISIIHRQSQIYISRELKQYNVNSSEYIYLVNLSSEESVNQKYLSDLLCLDEGLTTRVIKSLEAKGFVIREKSKIDKRSYNVRLSERGEELKPLIIEKLEYWTNSISEGFNQEKRETILKDLKNISQNAVHTIKKEKTKE